MTGNEIKKSALYDLVTRHSSFDFDQHVAVTPADGYDNWNGFLLPMAYTDSSDEYRAIREGCAVFDASPMRKHRFSGPGAGEFLDRLLTAPVSSLASMRAGYGLVCNDQGFLFDDGIMLKINDEDYLFLISEKDWDVLCHGCELPENITISDESEHWAGFAIQGPQSTAALVAAGFFGLETLEPFELRFYDLAGYEVLVGRLGFTGDLGYEAWFQPEAAQSIISAIDRAEKKLGFAIPGYGLSALQVCRIEAGMIVPGWDTAGEFEDSNQERTPFELTLGWNIKFNRDVEFMGRKALEAHKSHGPRYKMKGAILETDGELDFGEPVFSEIDGSATRVGTLPSVAWHPSDQYWIGFASIETEYLDSDGLFILKGNKRVNCKLVPTPFIDLPERSAVPAPL